MVCTDTQLKQWLCSDTVCVSPMIVGMQPPATCNRAGAVPRPIGPPLAQPIPIAVAPREAAPTTQPRWLIIALVLGGLFFVARAA